MLTFADMHAFCILGGMVSLGMWIQIQANSVVKCESRSSTQQCACQAMPTWREVYNSKESSQCLAFNLEWFNTRRIARVIERVVKKGR